MPFVKILCFEELSSTQIMLKEYLHVYPDTELPVCVLANYQSDGVGSRNNQWQSVENALTFSFALFLDNFPKDMPIQSCSIYVGFLFKEWLNDMGFNLWLKWPNDLYLDDFKVGGVITQVLRDKVLCGIGLNLQSQTYGALNVFWDMHEKERVVRGFLQFLFFFPTWMQIFRKYKLEFCKNFSFSFHDKENRTKSLVGAILCEDGSIYLDGERYFGSR